VQGLSNDGRAAIIFIDVWKNRDQAKNMASAFMDKKTIIKHLSALGVKPPEKYRDF